eukprot:GHVR01086627.1.p2 GENE.GHVR01086627.1~~GHVR01086627.1.p2  ORF type:complete len:104 (-),score=6.70 GHVR01086627.1:288-599(-)
MLFNNRKQLPLILAWAFTIHKSQGSTLEHYTLDLGDYETQPGLAYVGLSRGRSEKSFMLVGSTTSVQKSRFAPINQSSAVKLRMTEETRLLHLMHSKMASEDI